MLAKCCLKFWESCSNRNDYTLSLNEYDKDSHVVWIENKNLSKCANILYLNGFDQ